MLSKHHQISLNAYKSCEILLMETQARITACDLPKKKHEQRNEIESPPFSAFIRISGIRYTQKNAARYIAVSDHCDDACRMTDKGRKKNIVSAFCVSRHK